MRRPSVFVALMCLVLCVCAQAERALVAVPADRAPVLDGRQAPGEWGRAAALSGFTQPGAGALADPDTVVYLMYDAQALYFAFRCSEPDPKRPLGLRRDHDDHAYEDDCVQVFVAPEDLAKAGQAQINFGGYQGAYQNWYSDIKAYYEFTVNCEGSLCEARNDVRDWDAPWQAKVGREKGAWTVEMRIPFRSLGVERAPEGTLWGLNLFRMRQPDASGWVNTGHGGYTPLPLGAMRFVGQTPVARMEALASPEAGTNSLTCAVMNPAGAAAEAELSVTAPGHEPIASGWTIPAGGAASTSVAYETAATGGSATYAVKLKGQDTPLLTGSIPLPATPGTDISLRYYSVPAFVEGLVHLGGGERPVKATLTLEPTGGEVKTVSVELTGKPGERLRIPVVGEVGESFAAALTCLDAAGKIVASRDLGFTVPAKPEWVGTQAGLPLGVLPPWTPIKVSGRTVEMLGKRLTYGDLALPATVASAAAEILAAPMRIAVGSAGRPVQWVSRECRIVEQSDEHVKLESNWRSASLDLQVISTLEYDGFSWNEVTLTPRGKASVDRVALEIPLRPEACKLVYQGHAQACGALSPRGLKRPLANNFWLGNEARGLAFLTESEEWWQAKDRGRQVEVIPGEGQTLWRSNFIDTPTALTAPYTARFALHVTPAKPVSLRKSRIYHGAYYGMEEKHAGGQLSYPAKGHIDLDRGTLEFWAKPTFDTNEVYDPGKDRSAYNRVVLTLSTGSGQAIILYYNADDRNFRLLLVSGPGQYKLITSAPGQLPPGQWSYVALSWGDKLRLGVNGKVADAAVQGTVTGDISGQTLSFGLSDFQLDDLRISKVQRPVESLPTAAAAQDADTLLWNPCEDLARTDSCAVVAGHFGGALASSAAESMVDRLAREGKRIVIFHENWSRYQGLPDLEQIPKLKLIADACHERGMIFLVYFDQLMADTAPVWQGMAADFMALPERMWYHRDDVKQDDYVSCVNGPYGDLLLDGIAKLADQAGIDGVYMDGTTVPWDCINPTHPGCGEYLGDGTYRPHVTLRATREFMKRLRSIFAQRRKVLFLDAHTGGAINIATQSFCDGYYDGETLARYKPGYRLAPDIFAAGYMAKPWGFRGDFLPNRHTTDEALAISLIHDSATRGQPAAVDKAFDSYEGDHTRFIGYWERSALYSVAPGNVLGSLYLNPDRALLVLGSQTEATTQCTVDLRGALAKLPRGLQARDPMTGDALEMGDGKLRFELAGRMWKLVELRREAK